MFNAYGRAVDSTCAADDKYRVFIVLQFVRNIDAFAENSETIVNYLQWNSIDPSPSRVSTIERSLPWMVLSTGSMECHPVGETFDAFLRFDQSRRKMDFVSQPPTKPVLTAVRTSISALLGVFFRPPYLSVCS